MTGAGVLLVAVLQVTVSVHDARRDTLRPVPDAEDYATAYADEATRELVRQARSNRSRFDDGVFHYSATVHQLLSVGLRALRRDRLLFRRETVSEVDWWRDRPTVVRVVGAREAIPSAIPGFQIPDDLVDWAEDAVLQPDDDRLFMNPTDGGFAWHPLVPGGEALYRYAIGDSTVIRLPSGEPIRLVELRAIPRERDIRVVTGSFWIERDSYGIVQALFRPAREFNVERDVPEIDPDDADDIDEIPELFKPIIFTIEYITIDYGLWDLEWWMPRLSAFRGQLQVGAIRVPVTFETRYSDYTVEPDPLGLPPMPPVIVELAGYARSRPRTFRQRVRVEVADSAELLESPLLSESFFSDDQTLVTEGELRELADALRVLPPTPWQVSRPRITPPWALGRGLQRYNRVEGLSLGTRADWDLGRVRLDLTARLGLADLEPAAELGAGLPGLDRSWRVAGYRRLAVADPSIRPLGVGNSLTALLLGRDDGTYFRATGAEVRVTPERGGYELRLYAEAQRTADKSTDASLPSLWQDGPVFRPNLTATRANQVGISARVGRERGLDPTALRWGAWLDLTAETGTATFARPGLTARLALPVFGFLAAMEIGGGTTFHDGDGSTAQGAWFLGGPGTLRGFPGGALSGPDYGRARVELANTFPAARVAAFADAGWAGTFDGFREDDIAASVGVGVSLLDGLVRADLAHAVRPSAATRLELYLDAIF